MNDNAARLGMSEPQWHFLQRQPVARLATADAKGMPHVVPVCFVATAHGVFVTIDEKPKRSRTTPLKRIRNLMENPQAAMVVDRYHDDWSRLAWVMIRGEVELLSCGARHANAQTALREKYPQLRAMTIDDLPVIAINVAKVTGWGAL